jgi:hypothetical protein
MHRPPPIPSDPSQLISYFVKGMRDSISLAGVFQTRWTPVPFEQRDHIKCSIIAVLVGKPEGKRPLGRRRRRWEDNIRMNLQEVGCGVMGWIGLTQDRGRWRAIVNALMNLRV